MFWRNQLQVFLSFSLPLLFFHYCLRVIVNYSKISFLKFLFCCWFAWGKMLNYYYKYSSASWLGDMSAWAASSMSSLICFHECLNFLNSTSLHKSCRNWNCCVLYLWMKLRCWLALITSLLKVIGSVICYLPLKLLFWDSDKQSLIDF